MNKILFLGNTGILPVSWRRLSAMPGKSVAGMLAASLLLSCDRPKVEQANAPVPGVSSQEFGSNSSLTPFAPTNPPVGKSPAERDDSAPQMPPALQLERLPPAWELQLAEITSRFKGSNQARAIFALMPNLPPEALATAAEQAVEYLTHADYLEIAFPVLVNPETHGQVMSVLFADLLERPDSIALPALLSIAENPSHPFAPAALDDLRLLLEANYGQDWSRWNAAIRSKLAISQ